MGLIDLNSKKRVKVSDLNTRVTFYEYRPVEGPYPDEKEYKELYKCWAKIDSVWLKDLEEAKANGTESDVTLIIRDPVREYFPTNKHFLKIDAIEYEELVYNIKTSQPDLQKRDFYTIVAGLKDDMKWQ